MKKYALVKESSILTLFAVCISLVVSCGNNQKQEDTKEIAVEQNESKFDDKKQEKDAQFLVNASEMNLEEIQLGQLAQQKGSSTQVQELGKMMENAHAKSQSSLIALAKSKAITIPTSGTYEVKDSYKNLNEKSGNDFDKAYADMMVSEHKEAIDSFEEASKESVDGDIKNWAVTSLSDMRTHLDHSVDNQMKLAEIHLN